MNPSAQMFVSRAACVAAFGQWHGSTLKHPADLARHRWVLERERPEVVVELGRYNGASARWFAQFAEVVSVDTVPASAEDWADAEPTPYPIHVQTGNSVAEDTVGRVWDLVAERRAMVVLDSDHSTKHVLREIILYAPMVARGCHLVVEDTILAWLDRPTLARHTCWYDGNPLEAVHEADDLGHLRGFTRDVQVEVFDGSPTMHPSGWWRA